MEEFSATIKQEAERFGQSPTGQQVKGEWDDLKGRVESGEAEAYARQEILNVLRKVNSELEKASQRWQTRQANSGEAASPGTE